jgi:hypothetical protein
MAGIDELIANVVDRNIDYGTTWAFDSDIKNPSNDDESVITKQLKFFHQKDLEKKYSDKNLYVKAFYLHHLLDYFRETRFDIYDIDLIFDKFLQEKVKIHIVNNKGKKINFQIEIHQIFDLLKKNKRELYSDLRGEYLTRLDNKKEH